MKQFWGSLCGREKALLIWAAASTLIALVAIAGWVWRLQPMATVWGDLGTWFAGAVTLGGLYYAGRSLRLQTAQRAAEDEYRKSEVDRLLGVEAQKKAEVFRAQRSVAHAVEITTRPTLEHGVRGDTHIIVAAMTNQSDSAIRNVGLMIPLESDEIIKETVTTMQPGGSISAMARLSAEEGQSFKDASSKVYGYFTDMHGNHWRRTPTSLRYVEPIESTLNTGPPTINPAE